MEGIVIQQKDGSGIFNKVKEKYHMILTDQPRLFLWTEFDMNTRQEYKKDILLHPDIRCFVNGRNKFSIHC